MLPRPRVRTAPRPRTHAERAQAKREAELHRSLAAAERHKEALDGLRAACAKAEAERDELAAELAELRAKKSKKAKKDDEPAASEPTGSEETEQ